MRRPHQYPLEVIRQGEIANWHRYEEMLDRSFLVLVGST
jgi:hypothetical protein